MGENDSNFRDEVALNKDFLDDNAIEQPALYAKWSEAHAQAVLERDKAKDRFAITKAEVDEEIRKNPSKFGWESDKSPTVGFIEAQIILHKKYKAVQEELATAEHNVNIMSAAKNSFEQRGRMLAVLAELFKSNYFATNTRADSLKRDVSDQVRQAQEKHLDAARPVGPIRRKR